MSEIREGSPMKTRLRAETNVYASAGYLTTVTVREYEANGIASDSEDEKKIRQAESRAMRTAKDKSRRQHPYKTTSRPAPVETAPNPYYANQHIEKWLLIPFIDSPSSMYMKNNKSALKNNEFVSKSVNEVVLSGCVIEVPFQPYIVNPLSVATHKSEKRRLISDLSTLYLSVKKGNIKFEDWKIAVQYFQKTYYLYKFNLKSDYFHLDICPQQHTYLGFSWENKFYCVTVLTFGLSTGPYIFSKCLRPLVKYWSKNGIKIVLYLDDGFGMNYDYIECIKDADFVKQSLFNAGFLLNEEKSIFTPVQKLEWLGIIWDSCNFTLCIPQRIIDELLQSIHIVFREIPYISARNLAQVMGRIRSMAPVIGNITRIMTRYSYMSIESRMSWDSYLVLESKSFVISELKFWLDNIAYVNFKTLNQYSQSHVMICSDVSHVSSIAAGACTVELESEISHTMWKSTEMLESSTWRELKAIELALMSYQHAFAGKSLKWLTNDSNCVRIVQAGSMKEKLQYIAISIFSICLQKGISINTQWIPRGENSKADYISKIIDYDDWVSRNAKLERFNSLFWNVNTEAVDCLTQNWSGENNWIVSPIYLVLRAIKHVIACKAKDIFRVGRWKQNSDISDELSTLKTRLPEYCLSSSSLNTRKKYQYAFNAFCKWTKLHNIIPLPSSDYTVSLYLILFSQNSKSASKKNEVIYAISWAHKLA
ncbi:unnamed protein product [Mytilus coruscus]|uniref:Reverse transcriptase domain-containing protein n=1 Tax=Mytilus coruscus TaxID=42192 RepID=A0A6J8ACQ2_MYTCO|nr:unnamed protein product [Mytilus coruscus]